MTPPLPGPFRRSGLTFVVVLRSHTYTSHSVGLRTRNRPVAETATAFSLDPNIPSTLFSGTLSARDEVHCLCEVKLKRQFHTLRISRSLIGYVELGF